MWSPQYDIIVETLTGSEFEVTVTDKDTIGYIKSRIQKYEGNSLISSVGPNALLRYTAAVETSFIARNFTRMTRNVSLSPRGQVTISTAFAQMDAQSIACSDHRRVHSVSACHRMECALCISYTLRRHRVLAVDETKRIIQMRHMQIADCRE